jgi:hypothetical protein
MFYHVDYLYWIIMLATLLLSGTASLMTHFTFKKYSKVEALSHLTGAEAALRMLTANRVNNVTVERVDGFLSDHYDPSKKVLRLSPDVYDGTSLSSIGVACHEAGHALQDAKQYAPLAMRSALVPAAIVGNNFAYLIIMIGFLFHAMTMVKIGIVLFAGAVVFSIVTLPVEWDASARAKQQMVSCGIVTASEQSAAGKVLNAAFLTYVAAAISSLLMLLYFLFRAGFLGGGHSDD